MTLSKNKLKWAALWGLTFSNNVTRIEAKEKALGFYTRGSVEGKMPGERNGFDNPYSDRDPADGDPFPKDWGQAVDGIIVLEEWSRVQPNEPDRVLRRQDQLFMPPKCERTNMEHEDCKDLYGLNTETIDNAIAVLKEYNEEFGTDLKIKIRVLSGIYSPEWIYEHRDVGATYHVFRKRYEGYVPHYWKEAYMDFYRDLHVRLAKKYDNHEMISEVGVTACMLQHEDMHRPIDNENWTSRDDGRTLIGLLMDEGLTFENDFECQINQIKYTADAWKNTYFTVARPNIKDFSGHSGYAPKEGDQRGCVYDDGIKKVDNKPCTGEWVDKPDGPPTCKLRRVEEWPVDRKKLRQHVKQCQREEKCIIGNNSLDEDDAENDGESFDDRDGPVYYVSQQFEDDVNEMAGIYFQTTVDVAFQVRDKRTKKIRRHYLHEGLEIAIEKCRGKLGMIELPPLDNFLDDTASSCIKNPDKYLTRPANRGGTMQCIRKKLKGETLPEECEG